MKLLIGVMAFSSFEIQAVAPFCNCLLNTEKLYGVEIKVSPLRIRRLYWRAMNDYVQQAIRGHFDYLFFVDDDILLKDNTLIHLMNRHVPVVSATYIDRHHLHRPVLIKRHGEGSYSQIQEYDPNGMNEVDCTGFGCMLIERMVFEQLKPIDFEPMNLTPPGHWAVCKAIRKLGFKIFVDTACPVGHLKERKEVFEYGITEEILKGGNHVSMVKRLG